MLFFLLAFFFPIALPNPYCSSTCIDYTGACFDETPTGCWVCADHIFNMYINWGSSTPCSTLAQTTVLANELPNDPTMSLFGYTSSNPIPLTCTNYTFSGEYTCDDYIYKNFTGIPLNHYALVIRFNVGYMGDSWGTTDQLRLTMTDSVQTINYDYNYSCEISQEICGEAWNTTDCIRIREYTLQHNSSYILLNFSALTSQTNTTAQAWGIKELIIAAKECHAFCSTCYGGEASNCLSCASGYYLQGNVCLPQCDVNLYTIVDQSLCTSVCPSGYFHSTDSTGRKVCTNCAAGCLVCSDLSTCQAWETQAAYTPDLWSDKMEFWILLLIVVLVVVVILVYKIVKAALKPNDLEQQLHSNGSNDEKGSHKHSKKSKKSSSDSDEKNQHPLNAESKLQLDSEANVADSIILPDSKLWFNELVELEPTEVKVTRPRRRKRSPPNSQKPGSITEAVEMGTSVEF